MGFKNMDALWEDAAQRCVEFGENVESRVGKTREVLGFRARLDDVSQNWLTNPGRALSAQYAAGELVWYLSGTGNGDQICSYAPSYKKYLVGGVAPGAYGPRIMKSLNFLLWMLSKSNSRQAVIPLFTITDLEFAVVEGSPDVPCTLTMQFLRRENKLHLIVTMRSNDVWLGMPYDVWCFTTIQRMLAGAMGLETGFYQHQVGSLHLYEKNRISTEVALETKSRGPAPQLKFEFNNLAHLQDSISMLVANERDIRLRQALPINVGPYHIITVLSHLCAVQHGFDDVDALYEVMDEELVEYHCPHLLEKFL